MQVSNGVYALIKRAVEISRLHLGFNTAIGPLVKLWKIGFDGAQLPTQAQIDERLAIVDPANIELNDKDQTVFLKKEGMEID